MSLLSSENTQPGLHQSRHPSVVLLLCVLGFMLWVLSSFWQLSEKNFLTVADRLSYDFFSRAHEHDAIFYPQEGQVRKSVLISIDDHTIAAVGQWPWPRYKLGRFSQAILQANPAVLGVNILFLERDRTSLAVLQDTFRKEFGLELRFSGIPDGLSDNDTYLASVWQGHSVVGAMALHPERMPSGSRYAPRPLPLRNPERLKELLPELPLAATLQTNTLRLQRSFQDTGFVNVFKGHDGLLRQLPLLFSYEEEVYGAFGLVMLLQQLRATSLELGESFLGTELRIYRDVESDQPLLTLPLSRRGEVLFRFWPWEGQAFSAQELLQGNVSPDVLRDRMVFLGLDATGLQISYTTPVGNISASKVHAFFADSAIATIDGNVTFNRIPDWGLKYALILNVIIVLCITLFFIFFPPWSALIGMLMLLGCIIAASMYVFHVWGIYLPFAGSVCGGLVLCLLNSMAMYVFLQKHNQDLEDVSLRDPLTGLLNKVAFQILVKRTIARQGKLSGTFFFIDIDNFKTLNDTLGHQVGDKLLQEIATELRNIFRTEDSSGRFGGDEFCVFTPGMNFAGSLHSGERIISSIKRNIVGTCGKEVSISASVGIAQYPEEGTTYEVLEEQADKALYIAKRQGRNRFVSLRIISHTEVFAS